jgi:hypothetical protein
MRDSTRFVKVNTLVPRFRNDGLILFSMPDLG